MKKRNLVLGIAVVLAAAAVVGAKSGLLPANWNPWSPQGAVAQAPRAERNVPVDVAVAVKKRVPVRVDLLGTVAKDQALLEGAERDVRRYSDLVSKGATPVTNLDNSKTQVATFEGAIKA